MHFSLMDNYRKHSDVSIAYGIFGPMEIKTFSAKLLIVFCVEWRTDALLVNTCSLSPNKM